MQSCSKFVSFSDFKSNHPNASESTASSTKLTIHTCHIQPPHRHNLNPAPTSPTALVDLLLRLLPLQNPLQLVHLEHAVHDPIQKPLPNKRARPNQLRPTARPEPIRPSEPGPENQRPLARQRTRDQLFRIILRLHGGIVLRKGQPRLEELLAPHVDAILGQGAVGVARNLAADRSRHGDHDADAERLELETEGTRVRDDGALGGAVDGAEHVRGDGGQGSDVDDEALGGDQLVGKGLAHGHDAEDVGLEGLAHVVHVDVGCGVGVGAAAVRGPGVLVRLKKK